MNNILPLVPGVVISAEWVPVLSVWNVSVLITADSVTVAEFYRIRSSALMSVVRAPSNAWMHNLPDTEMCDVRRPSSGRGVLSDLLASANV